MVMILDKMTMKGVSGKTTTISYENNNNKICFHNNDIYPSNIIS